MPFGPNAITTGYGHSQYVANGLSAQVLQYVPAQSPANTIITGGSIDNTPIGQSIPAAGSFTTLTVTTPLGVASGGSGISTLPGNGKLLIGNGTGYTLANLTAGSGISITNASGSITIAQTNSPGTVTSVAASGGSTGLTFSGSPITTSGTLTLGGTLAIGSGGTNSTTASGARTNLGLDTMATQASTNVSITGGAIDGTVIGNTTPTTAKFTTITATGVAATRTDGNYQYTLASATKTYGFATSGSTFLLDDVTSSVNRFALTGSGVPSFSALSTNGFVKATGGVGTLTTSASVSLTADVSNTLPLANGGTGQTTANAAFNALAPSQTGNNGKYLTTDGSNTSWAVNPLGTVTSVSVTTANGVSGTVANSTTTPAISLTLGDITPSSVTALNNTGGYQIIAGQLTSGDRVGISGQASGTGTALVFFDNAQTTFRPSIFDASQHTFKISGTATTSITSTGIQSAIGATTPAAGTFTDVYATTLSDGFTNVAAAGTTTTLTSSSIRNYVVTGSGGQTYKLPDATTLRSGSMFQFNNNQSSGTIVVQNNSSTTITTIQSGGYVEVILLSNSTAAGTWDSHAQAPSNVTWSTNTFDYAGSITSATWNGTAVAINRGGTGQATAQLAINALAGAVTSGSYLRGNGTNVVMNTIQAADVPTLNQNTTGSAATLTTSRSIHGGSFNGSADVTNIIASTYGGTGNGFTKFSGPTTAEKTFTLPDSNATLLYSGGALGTPTSGTVTNLTGTASININGTVGATTRNTVAATTLDATKGSSGTVLNLLSGNASYYTDISIGRTAQEWFLGLAAAASNYATGTVAGDLVLGASGTANLFFGIANSVVGKFTSTGLNSTAIGATTASTGAFTTITGSTYIQATGGGNDVAKLYASGVLSTFQLGSPTESVAAWQYNRATGNLKLYGGTEGSFVERLNISSTGLTVTGLITASSSTASGQLKLQGSGQNAMRLATSTGAAGLIVGRSYSSDDANDFFIYNEASSSLMMRINASGNVGIGTSSPIARLDVNGSINFGSADGSCVAVGTTNTFTPSGGNPTAYYGMTFGGFVTNSISLSGYNGIAMYTGAGVERARIDSSGNLLVGTTSADGKISVSYSYPQTGQTMTSNSTSTHSAMIFNNPNGAVGSINTAASVCTFNSLSDYRRKSNVQDLTGSGTFIDSLKPRMFDWDTGNKGVGFIAHEFAEVSPSSVNGEKDAVDEDGKPKYQSMQASSAEVIANLVAELQSVRQRLAALENF